MSAAPSRRHDVDALRSLAVLLLIAFHTARLFDAEPWHMKDAGAPYAVAGTVVRLIGIWQMPLLFFLAGLSAAWGLERRDTVAFLRERAARLLVPLVVGMVLLVPPQVWVERATPAAPLRQSAPVFDGGFLDFLPHAFGCCYPAGNLSWHHLWFLPYLFLYSAALVPVARRGAAAGVACWVAASSARLTLPAVPLVLIEVSLRPAFPSTHDLISDLANHAHYLTLVVIGWWFGRNPVLEEAARRGLAAVLPAAVLLTAVALAVTPTGQGGLGHGPLPAPVRRAVATTAEWLWVLALLGAARAGLARPPRALRRFAAISLPFYAFHQTVIVVLGWFLFGWVGEPAAKAAVVAVGSLLVSLALALGTARIGALRALFGLARRAAVIDASPICKAAITQAE